MTPDVAHPAVKYTLGVLMVILGSCVAVMGGVRWRQTTNALRGQGSMPTPTAVLILIGGVVVLACALVVSMAVTGV